MDCTLTRTWYRSDGIFSKLEDSDGKQIAVTLEHAYQDSAGIWSPKIPPGVYTCERYASPHFGCEVFQVMNVPNCTNIEIHWGNYDRDSDGCIILGEEITDDGKEEMVTESKVTFLSFMTMQAGLDQFQLTVVGER